MNEWTYQAHTSTNGSLNIPNTIIIHLIYRDNNTAVKTKTKKTILNTGISVLEAENNAVSSTASEGWQKSTTTTFWTTKTSSAGRSTLTRRSGSPTPHSNLDNIVRASWFIISIQSRNAARPACFFSSAAVHKLECSRVIGFAYDVPIWSHSVLLHVRNQRMAIPPSPFSNYFAVDRISAPSNLRPNKFEMPGPSDSSFRWNKIFILFKKIQIKKKQWNELMQWLERGHKRGSLSGSLQRATYMYHKVDINVKNTHTQHKNTR